MDLAPGVVSAGALGEDCLETEQIRNTTFILDSSLLWGPLEYRLLEQCGKSVLSGIGYRHGRGHARNPLGGPGSIERHTRSDLSQHDDGCGYAHRGGPWRRCESDFRRRQS